MGRFGALFKKSEKEKPESNPYAQQPPAAQSPAQSSPPPQYDQYTQYNNSQYNENQYASQRPQGQPSGLPSGPRPGGLPGRVAPGPAFGNDKPPPQYSPQPGQYSPYGGGSPSLGSAAGTPVLPSNTSSPSMGTGFPREKYGASDGVGKNRFETAPSPYGNSTGAPPQRQGGYGNLGDTGSGGLFDNYNGPAKQAAGPVSGQAGAPYDPSGQYGESQLMTEEEREEAEVNDIKARIEQEQMQTNEVGRRNYARMVEANERMRAMNTQLLQNSETLERAEANTDRTQAQADISGVNLDDLDAANTTIWNFAANSKSRIASRAEKKMTIQQQQAALSERNRQENSLDRQWQIRQNELETAKPKGLLGAPSKKTDFSKFEFEDDTGRQREMNEEYEGIVDGLLQQTKEMRQQAEFQGFILDHQNAQIARLTNKVESADDTVTKHRIRLETKYK
jgi:hypothetical protein